MRTFDAICRRGSLGAVLKRRKAGDVQKNLLIVFAAFLFVGVSSVYGRGEMRLSSPDFANNALIPAKCTCDGANRNPTLVIEGIPAEAQSLALIMDDPDAPSGTWVHWVVYNIAITQRIGENSVPGIQGINDSGQKRYDGPCPPGGTHRYFFKIYALDTALNIPGTVNKAELERAMQGHVLGSAELIGLYKRNARF